MTFILLIGLRASGKTTVGKLLADGIAVPFIDLDDIALSQFEESSVTEVWTVHGEPAWRAAEVEALDAVLDGEIAVVALGGGTPMIERARAMIEHVRAQGRAVVVYLQCPVLTLEHRLTTAVGDRPALSDQGVVGEVAEMVRRREPTYQALADVVCDTAADNPAEVVVDISHQLKK